MTGLRSRIGNDATLSGRATVGGYPAPPRTPTPSREPSGGSLPDFARDVERRSTI
jgi:hypothetical protein